MVIVIDAKAEGRFDRLAVTPPPAVRLSPADYAANRPEPGTRVVIFRQGFDGDVNVDEIARFAAGLAEQRWGSLTVNDELAQACTGGQWRSGTIMLPRLFVRGRTKGVAQLWGTTSPHDVPTTVFDGSDVILQFATSGLALRLLRDREYLRGIDPAIIEALKGYPLPPAERGEFVLLRRRVPWDGKVYKLPPEF